MRRRGPIATALALAVVMALAVGACAGDDDATTSGGGAAGTEAPVDRAGGDDVGNEVDGDVDGDVGGDPTPERDATADEAAPVAPGTGPPTTTASQDGSPLRAGSVDDNADHPAFVSYLDRLAGEGITTRPFAADGRILVRVTGPGGRTAAGAEVVVTDDGRPVATLRTTADGTARFYPGLYGPVGDRYGVAVDGGEPLSAVPGETVAITTETVAFVPEQGVPVDIVFLLDATGSMADEIDRLTATVDTVAAQIATLDGAPDLRLALTQYRDEGDAFVTATTDFTADVDAFRTDLAGVVADGGGDYPEALDEGLAEALALPSWRDPATTLQMVFLVADAPPHVERTLDVTYVDAAADAVSRGIKVFPIASSESDDQAEAVFRQVAAVTGARFVFLSYGAGGAATGPGTDIDATDYEELPLDALIVRLVTEEIAALTGAEVPPPPTTEPPTTNPPGQ